MIHKLGDMSKIESQLSDTEMLTESKRLSLSYDFVKLFYFLKFSSTFKKCLNAGFCIPLLIEATTRLEKLAVSSCFYTVYRLVLFIVDGLCPYAPLSKIELFLGFIIFVV